MTKAILLVAVAAGPVTVRAQRRPHAHVRARQDLPILRQAGPGGEQMFETISDRLRYIA